MPPHRALCPAMCVELFQLRMDRLQRWLADRPEASIAVVCHHGVIAQLTGADFRNCEVGSFDCNGQTGGLRRRPVWANIFSFVP